MQATQTRKIALSLAVATPSIIHSVSASAAIAPSELKRPAGAEIVQQQNTADARAQLLNAMKQMSVSEKQSIGGDRIILAGNFAAKNSTNGCATGGIWCRGGQWSGGCTCAITRRIVAKPKK